MIWIEELTEEEKRNREDKKVKAILDYIRATSFSFEEFFHNCAKLPPEVREHRYYKTMLKYIITGR